MGKGGGGRAVGAHASEFKSGDKIYEKIGKGKWQAVGTVDKSDPYLPTNKLRVTTPDGKTREVDVNGMKLNDWRMRRDNKQYRVAWPESPNYLVPTKSGRYRKADGKVHPGDDPKGVPVKFEHIRPN